MEGLKILTLCVGAAVCYGIVHDQITARLCVEYFTVAHPPVFGTRDPTLLGLGWGVLATWWVGAIMGAMLCAVARAGTRPKVTARELVRPITVVLFVSAGVALLSGLTGYALTQRGMLMVAGGWETMIAPARHARFLGVAWAHGASYLASFIGGTCVVGGTWRERRRLALRAES